MKTKGQFAVVIDGEIAPSSVHTTLEGACSTLSRDHRMNGQVLDQDGQIVFGRGSGFRGLALYMLGGIDDFGQGGLGAH